MNTNFPTWAECLAEFAEGMREHKAKLTAQQIVGQTVEEPRASSVSPFLRKPHVSYADFMAGREQRDA